MPAVIIPPELEAKLGSEASHGLVRFVNELLGDERKNVIELVEDRFAKRVSETESRINERIMQSEARLRTEMAANGGEIQLNSTKPVGDAIAVGAKDFGWLGDNVTVPIFVGWYFFLWTVYLATLLPLVLQVMST